MSYYFSGHKLRTELVNAGSFKCVYIVRSFDTTANNPVQFRWLSSMRFTTGKHGTIFWHLELAFCPRDNVENDSEHMLLTIKHPSPHLSDYKVAIISPLFVLNNEGNKVEVIRSNAKLNDNTNQNPFCSQYPFLKTGLMEDPKTLWPSGTLKIVCYVNVDISMPKTQVIKLPRPIKMKCFSHLVENDEFTDVTLCAGSKEFRVHKIFLCARSRVFAAMFRSDMREKRENRVDIEDIDSKILEAILRYIYTNEIDEDVEIPELLIAADKYELLCLKQLCEEKMSKYVTFNDAHEYVYFANTHDCRLLGKFLEKFLVAVDPPRYTRCIVGVGPFKQRQTNLKSTQ